MDEALPRLRLAAPAKLNLSLRVVGKRANGFHELDGVMVLLELADELRLAPGDAGLFVEPSSSEVPREPTSNLAWRGFAAARGDTSRGSLSLTKRIPVAAGLGGGSSDAAAGWRLGRASAGAPERPTAAELTELAGIGADVPYFAAQAAVARVTGIGERVEPTALPPGTDTEVVLAVAPFPLSTAAVFAELREADWGRGDTAGNDLLAPARRIRPEVDDVVRLMVAAGAEPRMSGSGPTFFALLDDSARADALAGRLGRAGVSTLRTRLRKEPASIEAVAVSMKVQQ
jgi:4-diphosphocytidyl-2-C-methyl-D-erythritol kinase